MSPAPSVHHPRPNSRGFTLIELLTVIAIIGALVSILMPVVGTMRGGARKLTCQSNLRQLQMGLIAYAGDWRGHLMPAVYYRTLPPYGLVGPYEDWGQVLSDFMNLRPKAEPVKNRSELGIFNCPEVRAQRWQAGVGGTDFDTSYAGNGYNHIDQPWDGRYFNSSLRQQAHASELLSLNDGTYFRSESTTDDGAYTVPAKPKGLRRVRYLHLGQSNLVFADGHVESTYLLLPEQTDAAGLRRWKAL
jgi:prepilin-type N-terminal cleavage/methylation domain-containing protein/prepilin-type processing-associated H-X9-DG protein